MMHRSPARLVVPVLLVLAAAMGGPARAQSLLGLSIGAPASAANRLGLAAADSVMSAKLVVRGYKLPGGGTLEVTADRSDNRIVFLQQLLLGVPGLVPSDLAGFTFGKTTLSSIRRSCGSNGFAYKGGPAPSQIRDLYVLLNAYDIKGRPEVVIFLTALPVAAARQLSSTRPEDVAAMGDRAILVGMILAKRSYLEGAWGADRISDNPCPPINWVKRP
jgi:hypothetical protein